MKFLIVAVAGLLTVSGCASTNGLTQTVDQTRVVVIEPPQSLYNCPQIRQSDIPNPDTMTNQDLANFIEKYETNLRICGINMNKIKEYIAQAKANIENR